MEVQDTEKSREIERIHRVFSKLHLEEVEAQKLLSALLKGDSKIPVSLSIKNSSSSSSLPLPNWIPENLKQYLSLSIPDEPEYTLDLSSIFMLSPLGMLNEEFNANTVLDVCSAPGGKSILTSLLLKPKTIWANEKSKERYFRLKENIQRLGLKNLIPLNFDARDLRDTSDFSANLVLIDAPCTGQSLLGKGFTNFSAFGNPQIKSISAIQRGILSAVKSKVKENGFLLYSTCTFSKEENEDNIKWFLKKNDNFETIEVDSLKNYQSNLTEEHCYRLYPHYKEGAGGFTCLLRKLN